VAKAVAYARSMFGNEVFHIASGARTDVSTSAAGVVKFSITTGPVLVALLGTTNCPEFASLSLLFDEVKVMGFRYNYNSINPYNRGAAINSVPIAFLWDDEATLMPTNSNASMGALSNRYPLYREFSPDHSVAGEFRRPSPPDDYDWTPVSNMGSATSTLGGFVVVGDGTNTVSNIYGFMTYQYLCMWRVRV